jgi:4-alpha-glucanotransferase
VVEAVLAALGVDVTTEQGTAAALEHIRLRDWRRMIPPIYVMRQGADQRLWVHIPDGAPASVEITLEDDSVVTLEQMDHWVAPQEVDGVIIGEASFRLPGTLPLGWHTVVARSQGRRAKAPLVVAPERLDPGALIGSRQWGFMTQLYATRSTQSWGLGDTHDLSTLAEWSGGELGAGFVLVNPLHAASPVAPMAPSPYLPVTRRFTNPLYIHIEDVPEYATLPDSVRGRIDQLAEFLRERNASDDLLDRDAVWAAKRTALEAILDFGMSPEREEAFADYCAAEGRGLEDFATWCAITDVHSGDATTWPIGLSNPGTSGVAVFRMENAERIRFHRWLQFVVSEQLRDTQRRARAAGMRIGVMHDLAVGVHPEGADAWALQDVLARGVGVGAPPDMYNQQGQNWHQPPWRPDALAEAGFAPYRDMLRTVLSHAGGLRIDHVLGLFRMWWVPDGFPAAAGTFVRFDFNAMLGILMLEAHRAGAVIVGEDLGTVEPWVREELADRGILGTSVLWFEVDSDGRRLPPEDWRRDVLASITVHDLPPTAGFLRDEHVRIRSELDLLTVPEEQELAGAAADREAWARILTERGWLPAGFDLGSEADLDVMAVALHRAAAVSPSRLIGVGLPDMVGDRRAQNQPGTYQEYPNWRMPMTDADGTPVLLEDLLARPVLLERVLAALTR